MKRPKIKTSEIDFQVREWNMKNPIGIVVVFINDFGDAKETTTTSQAWNMGGHSAVIKLDGISGGYSLDRVKPLVL